MNDHGPAVIEDQEHDFQYVARLGRSKNEQSVWIVIIQGKFGELIPERVHDLASRKPMLAC
jgi:hypothetical protein